MASESEAKLLSDAADSASGWNRVAAYLEAAVAAIPKPPYEAISNPKELGKRVKNLCKQLKPRLKELFENCRALCQRIHGLLKELVKRISDICKSFYRYISDKVKQFVKWVSGLVQGVTRRLEHLD
eukprot:c47845_g1_i1 orf=122-499(+)